MLTLTTDALVNILPKFPNEAASPLSPAMPFSPFSPCGPLKLMPCGPCGWKQITH